MTAQRADELFFEALPAGTPEERALALAFKRGERGAYEQIHERYEARVLSVCRRMLGDPDDAQEAAQEAFLRVYQGLPRFNGRYRLGAWIVRITTNVCLDQLRARSRRPSDPAPLEIFDLESPLAEDTDPQILFLRHAEGRRVRKVLDSLPPLHRAAIVLRDFEGIPYSDIAETLGITEGQVKALLHRARKGFKRSWLAQFASMCLPAGLFKKWFKPWDLPQRTSESVGAVSQATESALSASGQFAASASQAMGACGGALHQCSQFMADKAAPIVAAVAVGAASVGVGVGVSVTRGGERAVDKPDIEATAAGPIIATDRAAFEERPPAVVPDRANVRGAVPRPVDEDAATAPGEESVVDPNSTPAPEPTPPAEPTPPPPAAEAPPEEPAPPVDAAPPVSISAPFAPVIGFDWGRPIPGLVPISNYAAVTCQPLSVEQRVETVVQDDDAPVSHAALLNLHAGKDVSVDFTVWKGGMEVPFSGAGELTRQETTDGLLKLEYEGLYETWKSEAEDMDLPLSGPFTVRLMLDCAASTVVQETVMFGANAATPPGE
jgi:RNA polymerase sigma-70 factor, ECF subfamily